MNIIKNINMLKESKLKHIKTEIKIMRTLHHPNIVGCKYILASKRNIYIVMPYIGGGTLFDLLRH